MQRNEQMKEVDEAIYAGQLTLQYLQNAKAELNSASGFGFADMLGLDLIGGIGKHMKIANAKEEMEKAKIQVTNFQKELNDVKATLNFNVNISDFLTFADFFFDGIIADWLVQSKISEAKNQVDNGIYQVQVILSDLNRIKSEL